jgi:hypothetical protein
MLFTTIEKHTQSFEKQQLLNCRRSWKSKINLTLSEPNDAIQR